MRNDTGERIRTARKKASMTQGDTGAECGLSDAAIRLYELGKRTPSKDIIEKLSISFGVAPEALCALTPESEREILEILFRLEKEQGCRPVISNESKACVVFENTNWKLRQMIADWVNARAELEDGKLTQEAYEDWKMKYI